MKPERDPGDQAQALSEPMHRGPRGAKRTMCKALFSVTDTSAGNRGAKANREVTWRRKSSGGLDDGNF
jgi:hypothetical protein